MAHYAFLDDSNTVTEVIVGNDENTDGIDWEQWYGEYRGAVCKRTSYNTRAGIYYDQQTAAPSPDQSQAFRKNYAGIGFSYDHARDAFIPPKPYPLWLLNNDSCVWEPPVAYPLDGKPYFWDETAGNWVEET